MIDPAISIFVHVRVHLIAQNGQNLWRIIRNNHKSSAIGRERRCGRWKIFDDDDRFVTCLPVNQPVFRGAQWSIRIQSGRNRRWSTREGERKILSSVKGFYVIMPRPPRVPLALVSLRFWSRGDRNSAWIICKQGLQVCRVLFLYWDIELFLRN